MAINSLAYVGVHSSDIKQWQSYGTAVLGMQDVSAQMNRGDGCLYLKMDDRPYRMLVIPSSQDRFAFAGWECNTEARLLETVKKLQGAGVDVEEAPTAEAAGRSVHRLFRFGDPAGNRHEIFCGLVSDFKRLVSPAGVSSFVTGNLGMGHVVLPAPNFDAMTGLFRDTLGFGLSDLMNIRFSDDPNEPAKRLWFMHCNARHHSLGFFEMEHPAGCIHLMLEVADVDEVGRCEDRRIAHDIKLSATLGRHANDHMVSFYMQSPGGFDIEYGAEGRAIDNWEDYNVFESTVPSFWGHDFSVGRQ